MRGAQARPARLTLAGAALVALAVAAVVVAPSVTAAPGATPAASLAVARAAAAPSGAWRLLPVPFDSGVAPTAMATFGQSGVAVVATGGLIAVSGDAGATWDAHNGPGGQGFDAVAFSDASHGWAAGPAGFLMRTADGGATWSPRYVSGLGTVSAIAARGSFIYTLGSNGIVASTDGGTTWHSQADATATAGLTCVVADDTGFGLAAGAGGAALITTGDGTWTSSPLPWSDDVVALALAATPDWNAGVPDLFAVSAGGVLASDDAGGTFTAVDSPPDAGLHSAAVMGGPRPTLLVCGSAGTLERLDLTSLTWTSDVGPVHGDLVSCAAGPGSIAYAVSSNGHVERTMSYGDAPASLGAAPATVVAGDSVTVSLASPIRATGTLVLESRAAGGKWEGLASWPWSAAPPAPDDVIDAPLATTSYRVRFVYGGATGATSASLDVGVRPDIELQRWSFVLHRGGVYRLSGRVLPSHPGGKVFVYTDRGGKWHRLTLGGTLKLIGGASFRTRLFGTPIKETYHLQVRMNADAGHLVGRSRIVKVTVL